MAIDLTVPSIALYVPDLERRVELRVADALTASAYVDSWDAGTVVKVERGLIVWPKWDNDSKEWRCAP